MTAQPLIPSIVAWVICLAFFWSMILFMLAIFVRERRQEAGLIYTFGGAILFVITFADRLRLTALHLRTPLEYLPGVTVAAAHFESSVIALTVLAVLYGLRVLVFYELIARPNASQGNERQTWVAREAINDLIAPSLAYYCLVACIAALAQGAYSLNLLGTLSVIAALLLLYYLSVIRYIIEQLTALFNIAALIAGRVWKYAKKIPVLIIIILVTLEGLRNSRPGSNTALAQWALTRLNQLEDELEISDSKTDATIRRLAQRLLSTNSTHAESEESTSL